MARSAGGQPVAGILYAVAGHWTYTAIVSDRAARMVIPGGAGAGITALAGTLATIAGAVCDARIRRKETDMKLNEVRECAFAIPLTSPSYPPGPYRFVDREILIFTDRTDHAALRAVVPEPLEAREPLVRYEFIRMPDSTGFGDYTESGQVIPVEFEGQCARHVCRRLNRPGFAGGVGV